MHQHFVGLDVGVSRDFTAMAVLRLGPQPAPDALPELHVVDLQRTRGTKFTVVAEEVARLVGHLEDAAVAVDVSGAGEGVWQECRRQGVRPVGITITGAASQKVGGGPLRWNVPQAALYEGVYRVFATDRYRVARDLPLAEQLVRELQQVRATRTDAGRVHYEVPRTEEGHGDVLMSLCLATLLAEREAGRHVMHHVHAGRREARERPTGTPRRRDTAKSVIERRRYEREERYRREGGDLWTPLGLGKDDL